jgi:hypothetical protein
MTVYLGIKRLLVCKIARVALARTVYIPVYDHILGGFPAKIAIYTPYI